MANTLDLVISSEKLTAAILQAPQQLVNELESKLGRGVQEIAREARGEAPKAFSTLVGSIDVDHPSRLEWLIGPSVNYGRAVEEGTGMFGPEGASSGEMPPVENIKDWIGVVGITPTTPGYDEDDLAWAIARSIALTGTQPQPYMTPAYDANIARLNKLADQAIDKVLN